MESAGRGDFGVCVAFLSVVSTVFSLHALFSGSRDDWHRVIAIIGRESNRDIHTWKAWMDFGRADLLA